MASHPMLFTPANEMMERQKKIHGGRVMKEIPPKLMDEVISNLSDADSGYGNPEGRDGELARRLARGHRGGQSFDPFRPLVRVSIPLFKPSEQGSKILFWGRRFVLVQPH